MNITIHRGTDQIGGCVTEYEHNGWRLFIDYGEQLPGSPKAILKIEGLNHGDLSRSALLITHYHGDHAGCIADLPEELPIYMGISAKEILKKWSGHVSYVDKKQKALNKRLNSVLTFLPGESIKWGEFNIIPILMDHSAFDAYGFSIETDGIKVFHTGDFRTHGFRSGKLPQVVEKYIGEIDYVVCEATNARRTDAAIKSERELQAEFTNVFVKNKYNVVYMSSTNIDRLFGLYHAAFKARRLFLVDEYQKSIMDIVAGKDRIYGRSELYRYKDSWSPITLYKDDNDFSVNDKFFNFLTKHGYVIVARSGIKFDNLLSKIPSDGRKTFLSTWKGYLDDSKISYNPSLAKSISNDYNYFHTSGHCNMKSLDNLLSLLRPKAIIPIHTDSPQTFVQQFKDKWHVVLLHDGETHKLTKNLI